MEFVCGLPRSPKNHDAIWVVVDRLTKSAHFIPIRMNYSLDKLAEIYINEIVRLHGVPASIVSDRYSRFTSGFWDSLQKALGTKLNFSIACHPQTDGQFERTIQTLEDMLRACALDFKGSWNDYLTLVEFAYNTPILRWLCMGESIDPWFVGMRMERGESWILRLFKGPMERLM